MYILWQRQHDSYFDIFFDVTFIDDNIRPFFNLLLRNKLEKMEPMTPLSYEFFKQRNLLDLAQIIATNYGSN